ncbi:MAG: hypothetical protein SCH98_04975 [Deferrisomatales bacterium]|nr:hypothetical protein [Deferrisomatales bacterium]
MSPGGVRAPGPVAGLTGRRILLFWAPLASTWLMMAVEGPFLAAVIARLAEPTPNLAAFGVALSLALILEAPVIMLMGAATALARDRESFRKLRWFAYGLSALVTAVMVLLLVPPVFDWTTTRLLALPQEVADRTRGALFLLLPWPGAIGYRRLYQGLLIRRGLTRRVGYGTAARLVAMATAAVGLAAAGLEGALVGGGALAAGVLAEALACRLMARGAVREILAGGEPEADPLTYRAIATFYYPLALSTTLTLAVHPLTTFFLAQGRSPVESLAVFPVVRSVVFLFSCLGLSYQEVGIALLGDRCEGYRPLRRFALILAAGASAALALLAFSPAADFWFQTVSGLPPELARFALWPTRVLTPVPALTVLLSFLRSLWVNRRDTGPITRATVAEVGAIGVVLYLGIGHLDAVGLHAAAAALVVGRVCSNALLLAGRADRRPCPETAR